MLAIGALGRELGVTADPISAPSVLEPTGSGIWDAIKTALAPLIWAFNSLASFLQIMTFQADIPALANTFIVLPLGFFMGWTFIRLVRGGG